MRLGINNIEVPIWPVSLLILFILLYFQYRRKQSRYQTICSLIFGLYILIAIDFAFFPIDINTGFADAMRESPFILHVNTKPFYFGDLHYHFDLTLLHIFNNILLTIPFGFGVSFASRIRPRDILWLPFAVGFGIEAVQLVISMILGYPYHIIDINDALLNAIGVFIGYGIFRLFAWWFIKITGSARKKPTEWFEYFHEVVTRV